MTLLATAIVLVAASVLIAYRSMPPLGADDGGVGRLDVGRMARSMSWVVASRPRASGAVGGALILGLVMIIGAGYISGSVLRALVGWSSPAVDTSIQQFIVHHRAMWLNEVMEKVTIAGDSTVIFLLAVGGGLILSRLAHSPRPLGLLLATYVGARAIETVVKVLVRRPRPPAADALGDFSRFAYPSGHATHAMSMYVMLAILVTCLTSRRHSGLTLRVLVPVTASLILLVGTSRIYLGAHWITDVVGGFGLGALWVVVLVATTRRLDEWRARYGPDSVHHSGTRPPRPVHGGDATRKRSGNTRN
jgi:membrane-associated phospholipid phosphatase